MGERFSIAIDGPSGAGKSSVAKLVAARLGAIYLDTGAMYRAVALYMLNMDVDVEDARAVSARCAEAIVDIRYEGDEQRVLLRGEDVTCALRAARVSAAASAVSRVPAVRARLVAGQRDIAAQRSVVMDGRDIGTKVLPDATLKVYLTASLEERARRRYLEVRAGGSDETYEQVLAAMRVRDHSDSTREASPLLRAPDAVEVDTTDSPVDGVATAIVGLLEDRLSARRERAGKGGA